MDNTFVHKVCFKCKKEKPLSDFYKHKRMRDGHLNKCKECTRNDVSIHRELNIDKIRAHDRERGADPFRVKRNSERMIIYKAKNPDKYKAHCMVNNAIKRGRIQRQPCIICGSTERVEAHHEDYSKPLDVVFLCSAHHSFVHYGKVCLLP